MENTKNRSARRVRLTRSLSEPPGPDQKVFQGLVSRDHSALPIREKDSSNISTTSITTSPTQTLSSAKTLISRLRLDRNVWRNRSAKQTSHITDLKTSNRDLDRRLNGALQAGNQLLKRYLEQRDKNADDKVAREMFEKNRLISRLKKSDRAKGKVFQRNLVLKAALRNQPKQDGTNEMLLEALAAANDRIAELEGAGEELLEALEREDSDSEMSEEEEEARGGGLLGATVKMRNVLEDETFKEGTELWSELLDN